MEIYPVDIEVGDLVIVLNHIDWIDFYVSSGELAFVVYVHPKNVYSLEIYDCIIRTLYGGEIEVWFNEIKKLEYNFDE